jgi:prepilin-type N-terminal cleavage/methylation domain-containing protein
MFSKKDNKGFTLMEMLIVVAIIAILIAIMIPTFNAQLEKSREAADAANIRSAYAEVLVSYLDNQKADSQEVTLTQEVDGWGNAELGTTLEKLVGTDNYSGTPKANGTCTVSVDANGTAKIDFAE